MNKRFKLKNSNEEVFIGDIITKCTTENTKYGKKIIMDEIQITTENIYDLVKNGIIEEMYSDIDNFITNLSTSFHLKSEKEISLLISFLQSLYTVDSKGFYRFIAYYMHNSLNAKKGCSSEKSNYKQYYISTLRTIIGRDQYSPDNFLYGYFDNEEDAKQALKRINTIAYHIFNTFSDKSMINND